MLNIKSSFILENIFSFMEEKTKLDITKYNKIFQKKLNITVINYKILSQKYIIFEGKGKGKEYNDDGKLVFEGEYLNRKKMDMEKNTMIMVSQFLKEYI